MSFRVASTPLALSLAEPQQRQGGVDPAALASVIEAPGLEAQLERLGRPDALVVTTGQQPALFTGPLYTIHKALSAAALATILERRWQRPVVPVFWVAGDDHDWAEARAASWIGADHELVTAKLRARAPDAVMTPLSRELLGPEVLDAISLLDSTLPTGASRDAAISWVRRHFNPERSVAAAAGAALAELLAPFGVVCLDPTTRDMKRAAARHLVKALGLATDLDRDLGRRAAELIDQGRDAGVPVGDGATLVMLDGTAGRDRLVADSGAFVTRRSRERVTSAELQAIAAENPERLSANVLLRPVIESAVLPTVAYCAGPGELRYLPLAKPVFERMRIHRPLPVARWSGTVVEAQVDRVLGKFGFSLDELLDPSADIAGRAMRDRVPPGAAAALAGLRSDLSARYEALRGAVEAVDVTLVRPVDGALQRSLDALARVEKKLVRNLKRRHATELRQLMRARASVLPGGQPQERVVTVASLLARHGDAVLERVAEAAADWYAAALEGRAVPA